MSLETFTGDAVAPLLRRAHAQLGADARVLRLDCNAGVYQLVATTDSEFQVELSRKLREPVRPPLMPVSPAGRPLVVALIGPTGAGKTTAVAKLAMSVHAFGGKRVGLLGLDTYKVGAVEQLATWAEVARIPLTIVWSAEEVAAALERLSSCDVILVDTPGRGPRREADLTEIQSILTALKPDETHLVIPAGRLWRLQAAALDAYRGIRVTHLLASKVDECPDDWGVFELAVARELPMRWISDGQDVPADLRPAADRMAGAAVRRPAKTRSAEVA